MKKKKFKMMNIGTVSLLMIFIVLCLVTFAVLSLSSSVSDLRFSQALKEQTDAYYEASNLATEEVAAIDQILISAYDRSQEDTDFLREIQAGLSGLADAEDYKLNFSEDNRTISFQVTVNDRQALFVSLEIPAADTFAQEHYQITYWSKVQTEKWEGDDHLNVAPTL